MTPMTSTQVRRAFLDYFASQGHHEVASSSLVPADDPSLLFANSGMVQFKDVFLGRASRDYDRATTSQKCMRVSGKHNDLEEVGPSPSHHTFFEMLGNFSFGAYFKREACAYAYELLTKTYGLPPERLGLYRLSRRRRCLRYLGEADGHRPAPRRPHGAGNEFLADGRGRTLWSHQRNPLGPLTPNVGEESIIPLLQHEDERFLEIWNLVFMQFNRTEPDPEHTGTHDQHLPQPGVDTGMGLERITSVLQGVASTYETDLFQAIMRATAELTGHDEEQRRAQQVAYRVIADHARAAVFLIADGVRPGAKGRDSVCRTVIRRAARFGQQLGLTDPFLHRVAETVIFEMFTHYDELLAAKEADITQAILREEERFGQTLARGIGELDALLEQLPAGGELAGERAFYLHATLGLPLQVTKDITRERGLTVDLAGYQAAEAAHAAISGGETNRFVDESYAWLLEEIQSDGKLPAGGVSYEPYGPLSLETEALAITCGGRLLPRAIVGETVDIVLARQPFYAEAGGQVSDHGWIRGNGWVVEVQEVLRAPGNLMLLRGEVLEGQPQPGPVTARVDDKRRAAITRNHTATHLLHAALREVLGSHVQQRGSLVAPDRLRFRFHAWRARQLGGSARNRGDG